MPTITFANPKGGAGKTTAVLLLACELVRRGYRVAVVDADPQRWISRWFEGAGSGPDLRVSSYVSTSNFETTVAGFRTSHDYVLVDLPGMQSPLLPMAMGLSDHVLIPIQGSAMDAEGGALVLELLQLLERRANFRVPHSVVLSRVNSLVTTRALRAVKDLLAARSVRVLETPIIERAAYRDMFEYRTRLHRLDPLKVSNLDKAVMNAERYADEVELLVPAERHFAAANHDMMLAIMEETRRIA